jgi:ATP-binding cassette subfamily F protein uup
LQRARETAENPAIASDAAQLQSALHELASAQVATDALYARWAELEAKLG